MDCNCTGCIDVKVFYLKQNSTPNDKNGYLTYSWMNTPNPLLCGVTPNIYIEAGHGLKLIKMLEEKCHTKQTLNILTARQ